MKKYRIISLLYNLAYGIVSPIVILIFYFSFSSLILGQRIIGFNDNEPEFKLGAFILTLVFVIIYLAALIIPNLFFIRKVDKKPRLLLCNTGMLLLGATVYPIYAFIDYYSSTAH